MLQVLISRLFYKNLTKILAKADKFVVALEKVAEQRQAEVERHTAAINAANNAIATAVGEREKAKRVAAKVRDLLS